VVAVPTVVYVGSSNVRGLNTSVLQAAGAEWERIFGIPFSLSGQGSPITTPGPGFPIRGTMPAARMWTAKLPYAVKQTRSIRVGASFSGTTIEYTGTHVDAKRDSYVFVSKNSNAGGGDPGGQGNFRKVVSDVSGGGNGPHTLTVSPAWDPAVHGDGEMEFFADSYTILAVSAEQLTLTKTAETPDWTTNQFQGKTLVVVNTVGVSDDRLVVSNTTNTVTVDLEVGSGFVAGDSLHLMLGAGAAHTIAELAAHSGASLSPLKVELDTSPFLRTGTDSSNNIHNQPGHRANDLTFNAMPELMRLFRRRYSGSIYGLCMGRDSATISPYTILHGRLFGGWQRSTTQLDFNPSSPNSCFVAMASALLSMQVLMALEGNTMDVVAFVLLLAENDAQVQLYPKIDDIGDHFTVFMGAMRTLLAKPTMPFVLVGPSSLEWLPRRDEVYTQLETIEAKDAWSGVTDTRPPTLPVVYVTGESPPVHLDTATQVNVLPKAIFDTWDDIVQRDGELPDATSFVVEDGTAKVDANALCTVEFADAYLLSLEDPAEWRSATTKEKRDAIRRMSRWVSFKKYYLGEKVEPDQSMAFPRFNLVDEDGYAVDSLSVPLRVQQATAYGACRILKGDWAPFPDEEPNVGTTSSSTSVGPISISESFAGPKQTSTEVKLPLVDQLLSIFVAPTVAVRIGRG